MKIEAHISRFLRAERGASLVELAVVLPLLLLLLMGAVDFGRAFYLSMEVSGAAESGAEYGSLNPTDFTGMVGAAQAGAPNVANLAVATPGYGCECADGTAFSSNCSTVPSCPTNNLVYRVTVKTSANYTPLFPWPKIPSSMLLSDSVTMRAGSNQ